MLSLLFAAAFGRVVDKDTPFTNEEYWTLWQHFQTLEGHSGYSTVSEHNSRFEIFKKNMDFAREFNAENDGTYTFTMGVTIFADQTQDEFQAYLDKSSRTKPADVKNGVIYDPSLYPAPEEEVDWVSQGYVTPVKNQGSCGSCWAFSTTGGIEGQNYKVNKVLSSFSEQELVDCSQKEGNQGCNGGLMDDGFTYVEDKGLCFESSYPYTGKDGTCDTSCTSKVTVTGFTDIKQGDTSGLLSACSSQGPISIAVDANIWWQMYTGGLFNHNCNPSKLDHGVLLVGYSKGSYWKVKNSWGSGWGEKGYIRLTGTDANTCGLANSASYPTVAKN